MDGWKQGGYLAPSLASRSTDPIFSSSMGLPQNLTSSSRRRRSTGEPLYSAWCQESGERREEEARGKERWGGCGLYESIRLMATPFLPNRPVRPAKP